MPRLPRLCPPGITLHLVQRGHNRQRCFDTDIDYATYATRLKEAAQRYSVSIHAWTLMTNHVHLLVTPGHGDSISKMMQTLNRNYVCYYNQTYQRSGTLWEGRFKSCLIDSANYLLHCYRYIELNPVRAGIVLDPADYAWSSYRSNALGYPSSMLSPHAGYLALSSHVEYRRQAYRDLFKEPLNTQTLADIREATSRNMALGSNDFKEEIETATARRVTTAKPGRKHRRHIAFEIRL